MRAFASVLFFACLPLVAFGAITPEQLRQMAYDGDVHGAEAALRDAHQETLDGTLAYNDLRDLVTTLIVTHPDVIDFVKNWRMEYPGSPYADTLWVFHQQEAAWAIRTNRVASRVPREAMQTFRVMQQQGMEVAMRAYERAPDYVLASDAVFTHNVTTKALSASGHFELLQDVMAVTPSRDSLARASMLTLPEWGGPGHGAILRLCEIFAGQITDVDGYTNDVCAVDLIHYVPSNNSAGRTYSYRLMETVDHPILAKARARRALDLRSDEDRGDIIGYLSQPDVVDDRMMQKFIWDFGPPDAEFDPWDEEGAAFLELYDAQLRDYVEQGLLHDPYNPDVLFHAYEIYDPYVHNPLTNSEEYDPDLAKMYILLHKRHVFMSSFSAPAWHNLANGVSAQSRAEGSVMDRATLHDAPRVNAVYFGNHESSYIAHFLQDKLSIYRHLRRLEETGEENPFTVEEELAHVTCPIARLHRLYRASCAAQGDCERSFSHVKIWGAEVFDEITQNGLCEDERAAPLDSLFYSEPLPYDLGDLNEGIANR